MQRALCAFTQDWSAGALGVTDRMDSGAGFGVPGIAVEPWFIKDAEPIRSEADAQATPPTAVTLDCSRRRETITPAILRRRDISEHLIR